MREPEDIKQTEEKASGCDPAWEALRSGNTQAFEDIFRKFYPVLYNYGMKFSQNDEEIKDCIQSLFLQIWERRSFLGPTTSAKNYLLASLRRLLHKNSLNPVQSYFQVNPDFQVEFSVESKMIASQTNAENLALVRAAFAKLPARQKEAIFLRFYDNQDFDQIAAIMGITVRATYKLIYKGLDGLQEQFGDKKVSLNELLTTLFLIAAQMDTPL